MTDLLPLLSMLNRTSVSSWIDQIPFGAAAAALSFDCREQFLAEASAQQFACSSNLLLRLERMLIERISSFSAPSFVLQMHAMSLEAPLAGKSSSSRFRSFERELLQCGDLLQEIPLLKEIIEKTLSFWKENCLRLLSRLQRDKKELEALFFQGSSVGELVDLRWELSDLHLNQQEVCQLFFSSGYSLFYKPKSLAMDLLFCEAATLLVQSGLTPFIKTPRMLAKNGYGWVEKIDYVPCCSLSQGREYYERAGVVLALSSLLGGVDLHCENLIAQGEHPVLVDAETLLHPPTEKGPHRLARVGLLPKDRLGIDLSGFGGKGGQRVPFLSPEWRGVGTDQMHLSYAQKRSVARQNLPRLQKRLLPAEKFVAQISSGFAACYQVVMRNRSLWIGESGLLQHYAQERCRVILRPTIVYAKLQQQLLDPIHLNSRSAQEHLFSFHLKPITARDEVASAERRALLQMDVPLFHAALSSGDLYCGEELLVRAFYSKSPLEEAEERISQMNESEMRGQLEEISEAFFLGTALRLSKNMQAATVRL